MEVQAHPLHTGRAQPLMPNNSNTHGLFRNSACHLATLLQQHNQHQHQHQHQRLRHPASPPRSPSHPVDPAESADCDWDLPISVRPRKRLWASHREAEMPADLGLWGVDEDQTPKRFCKSSAYDADELDFPLPMPFPITVDNVRPQMMEETDNVQLFVKGLGGKSLAVCGLLNGDVTQLFHCLGSAGGICDDRLRFVFGGKQLEVGRPLSSYGVRKGSNIYLTGWLKSCDRSDVDREIEDEALEVSCSSSSSSTSRPRHECEVDTEMEGANLGACNKAQTIARWESSMGARGPIAVKLSRSGARDCSARSTSERVRRPSLRHVIRQIGQKPGPKGTSVLSWLKNRRRTLPVADAWAGWDALSITPRMFVL